MNNEGLVYSPGSLGRKYFAYDNTTYTYTGTTVATIVRTIYIPAGSMNENSTLELMSRFTKTGIAGNVTSSFYVTTNPTSLISGFVMWQVQAGSSNNLGWGSLIRITNKNSLSSQIYNQQSKSDFWSTQTSTWLSGTVDFSVNQYIHIYMTLVSAADTTGITDYQCYIDKP